ncbi:MAG: ABC transporter ATP-binding protein [Moorea sp. SIO1F2]|uniref:dipeptide ABC transporter ATP-binding protein n=1 Tax=Moorena sp. SIO1F2 TaxID=2607819 RepID=UPI0013B76598|nr:ABC transporter ATP-binding protein [Moorena sp. SIO1F2]NET85146.1 ABC transporter ATP-binding protein [Moorena sp. SIO1F2]
MSAPLLCVENLQVAYPSSQSLEKPTWAVDDVSFMLDSGERLGLVGESGCGKSTLGRAIMQLLPQRSQVKGKVRFAGKSVFDLTPTQLRQFRGEAVALVFQDPMTRLDPLMTIGEHCLETLKAHQPQLSRRESRAKVLEALDAVKIPANRFSQYPHEFSGGMRQRVAIALALLLNPKLIVADEPTTSLDVTVEAQILEELTMACRERDMALLLISHDLAMIGEYCDRIAVMYGGKMVETGPVAQILWQPNHDYTRSLLEAALHLQAVKDHNNSHDPEGNSSSAIPTPLLRVTNLKQYYTLESNFIQQLVSQEQNVIKAVDNVSFDLYPGEILGLVGESGCGKSTLSRTILQLVRPTAGTVEFQGTNLATLNRHSLQEIRRQIQMVFQDPHACLNPLMTVGESIADPLFIHKLAANPTAAKNHVKEMLERVGLTPVEDYYNRYPADLSGGQQQRVAIARALITHPSLVICDEPVSMLDASVQTQVLELMLELKEAFNLTYLFITHDLWVARFFCDGIAVMNKGQIVEKKPTHDLFTNPEHPYTRTLLEAAPLLDKQR